MKVPSSEDRDPLSWKRWLYTANRTKIADRVSILKSTAPFLAQKNLAGEITNSLLAKSVAGVLYPANYKVLQEEGHIPLFNSDWLVEVLWNSALFIKHCAAISDFIKCRQEIESALILSRFSAAESTLAELKDRYGVSLWTLEREFLLRQYKGGFQANKAFLSMVHEEKCSPYVHYLASLFSLKTEQESLPIYYRKVLKQKVYSVWPDPQNLIREYICSYAEPFNQDVTRNKSFCLWRDSNGSLFDRYIQTLKVIRKAIVAGLTPEESARLVPILTMMEGAIKDSALSDLRNAVSGQMGLIRKNPESVKFMAVLDLFTVGKYIEVIEQCRIMISESALNFGCFELISKASVHAGVSPPKITEGESLANRIVVHLCSIFGESTNYGKAELSLETISLQLGESHIAICLRALIDHLNGEKGQFINQLARFYTCVDNPGTRLTARGRTAEAAINEFVVEYPDSVTCAFLLKKAQQSISESENLIDVEPRRWLMTKARELVEKKRSEAALELLATLTETNDRFPDCVTAECIELKFNALRAMDNPGGALALLSGEYIKNKELVRRLPVANFLEEVGTQASPEIVCSMEYLLARSVIAESVQEVYEALDDFLYSNACEKPRSVFEIAHRFEHSLFSYVVINIMRRDVLSRGGYCSSSASLDEERLFLLNSLGTLNAVKPLTDIRAEISALHKEILIRAATQHVNEARVAINFDGIREASDLVRPLFQRYKALREAESNTQISLIPLTSINLVAETASSVKEPPVARVQESSVVFHEFCLSIMIDFCLLSDTYGLDATLSARIRHGALNNMLRSPFEAGALITRKTVSRESYVPSEAWQNFLIENDVSSDLITQFHLAQVKFTKGVDAVVSYLQKHLLQIRLLDVHELRVLFPQYTNRPEGMFNYSKIFRLIPMYEADIGRTSSSLDEVIDRLFEAFVSYTGDLLSEIRNHLQQNTHRELRDLIDFFLTEARLLSLPAKVQGKLQDEVNKSRIELQGMIGKLSEWFYFKRPLAYPDYPLAVTYEAVLEAINACSNGSLDYAVSEIPDLKCRGAYFHAMYDIFFTLLYNVVEHGDLTKDKIGLQVRCTVTGGFLTLRVSNKVNLDKDLNALVDTANELIALPINDETRRVAGEGKSGFLKIKKILVRDLGRTQWSMEAAPNENNQFVLTLICEDENLFTQ
jgi:hypothetical protein